MPKSPVIPVGIKRGDLFDALEPLLDLLGVDVDDVYDGIHIASDRISFCVVAREPGDEDAPVLRAEREYPSGDARRLALGELCHRVDVRIA